MGVRLRRARSQGKVRKPSSHSLSPSEAEQSEHYITGVVAEAYFSLPGKDLYKNNRDAQVGKIRIKALNLGDQSVRGLGYMDPGGRLVEN